MEINKHNNELPEQLKEKFNMEILWETVFQEIRTRMEEHNFHPDSLHDIFNAGKHKGFKWDVVNNVSGLDFETKEAH